MLMRGIPGTEYQEVMYNYYRCTMFTAWEIHYMILLETKFRRLKCYSDSFSVYAVDIREK